MYSDLTIIIPTINERVNLEILLPELHKRYSGAHIIISDDGSLDGTEEFIKDKVSSGDTLTTLLARKENRIITADNMIGRELFLEDQLAIRSLKGLTSSVIDALLITETDKFAVIDADMQHPTSLIDDMYKAVQESDLAAAYRAEMINFPFYRKVISFTGTMAANFVLPPHSRVRDPLSGAFAGRTSVIVPLIRRSSDFRLEGFKILFDLLRILPKDITITQTGYTFGGVRTRGESKIGWKQMVSFFKSVAGIQERKLFSGVLLLFIISAASAVLALALGDTAITAAVRSFAKNHKHILAAAKLFTDYGNQAYYILFASFIAWGLLKKKKRLLRAGLLYLLVQFIASVIITGGLKIAVGRPRPGHGFQHHFFTSHSTYKSFPSGHTADAFSSAGVLWGFLQNGYLLSSVSFLYSAMIGVSRMMVNAHYFSDVVTGMIIGFMTGLIVIYKKL